MDITIGNMNIKDIRTDTEPTRIYFKLKRWEYLYQEDEGNIYITYSIVSKKPASKCTVIFEGSCNEYKENTSPAVAVFKYLQRHIIPAQTSK